MIRSGYIVAGFETLTSITDNFIKNSKGRYTNNFTRDDISKFLGETCSGFLHSYGQYFPGKKNYSKYNKSEADTFRKCRNTGFFNNSDFIVDSGGFQISIGRLTLNESNLLLKMYYEFLEENNDVYDRAFILDVPPGPGCDIFHTFDQLYDLNLWSYQKAKKLSDITRNKMIYIHHFRTPKLWELFTKILRDYDMFNSFQYHGTGGVVANMKSDLTIPCIIYVLPIITLLNECKKYNRSLLNFHVLGGSSFRDILFYELFKIHVKEIHNIELNITYDSSGLFKALMRGRFLQVYDGSKYIKMDIRTDNLDMRFKNDMKVIDMYKSYIEKLVQRHPQIKPIKIDNIYNNDTGTFYEEVKVYSMLAMLDQYSILQEMMRNKAKEIYPLYKNDNMNDFINQVSLITQSLNSGKVTRKQTVKSVSIVKSLDMLTNLDEDYCKHIVDTFLVKDEFIDLEPRTKIMEI